MKKLLLFLVMVPFLFSNCKKDPKQSVVVSTYIDIAYKDNLGVDLLNPSIANYFSPTNIHVFTLVDGVKKEVNNPMMDYPHDYLIYKNDSLNLYFIRVFLHDTTILQLNQTITDEITCTIDKSNGNEIIRKLWYNGILKWEYPVAQVITIVK